MVIRRQAEMEWQPRGIWSPRLKLWGCQRSLNPEKFVKTCPRRGFLSLFPRQFLTLSGVLIGFWLIHTDVRVSASAHFTRRLIWLALRWHPAASNEARSRGRRTRGQRGNYNSTGFHLALSSTTPPVFEPRLKTFKNRQRERKKRGERERKRGREEVQWQQKTPSAVKTQCHCISKGNW